MSSYILSLLKSIGEFAVEAAAAALRMDPCYSQVNAFFIRLINSGQNIYGAMDLLYHWGILLSVLSCSYIMQAFCSLFDEVQHVIITELFISTCCII